MTSDRNSTTVETQRMAETLQKYLHCMIRLLCVLRLGETSRHEYVVQVDEYWVPDCQEYFLYY